MPPHPTKARTIPNKTRNGPGRQSPAARPSALSLVPCLLRVPHSGKVRCLHLWPGRFRPFPERRVQIDEVNRLFLDIPPQNVQVIAVVKQILRVYRPFNKTSVYSLCLTLPP